MSRYRPTDAASQTLRITAVEAFWLATAGGGIALDMPIGVFAPAYQFDAILVDANAGDSNLLLYPDDGPYDILQKIIYSAGRTNVSKVWVAGRLVRTIGPKSQD